MQYKLTLLFDEKPWTVAAKVAQAMVDLKLSNELTVHSSYEPDFECPHCGSTKGTWFDRTEPMANRCEDCGKDVSEDPEDDNDPG